MDKLEAEIVDTQLEIVDLENEIYELNATNDSLESIIKKNDGKIDDLSNHNENLDNEKNVENDNIEKNNETIKSKKSEIVKKNIAVQVAQNSITSVEALTGAFFGHSLAVVAELTTTIAGLKVAIGVLEHDIEDCNTNIEESNLKIENYTEEINVNNQIIKILQSNN